MPKKFVTKSAQETKSLAKKLAGKLPGGTIICLYGELAAGKTTFTQGLGEYFGIDRIISPTYIILRQYPTNNKTIKRFNHLDLYRLSSYKEAKSFDLDELWSDKEALTVIEWPDRLEDHLPAKHLDINFSIISDNEREITLTNLPA